MCYVKNMKMAPWQRLPGLLGDSRGIALLETVVAITIMASLGTAVLMGVRAAHTSTDVVEVHSNAERLARNQMEYAFNQPYATPGGTYISIADASEMPFAVESGYAVTAQAVVYTEGDASIVTDNDIEKVVVTVSRDGQDILVLQTLRINE